MSGAQQRRTCGRSLDRLRERDGALRVVSRQRSIVLQERAAGAGLGFRVDAVELSAHLGVRTE